jgi:RNA:NAD 2'-phosphotransferase (TPT1/KptA family)
MKKLQGTRAGRPIAIAFDTELLMQMGYKLFATDEAILILQTGFQIWH